MNDRKATKRDKRSSLYVRRRRLTRVEIITETYCLEWYLVAPLPNFHVLGKMCCTHFVEAILTGEVIHACEFGAEIDDLEFVGKGLR